MKRYFNLWPFLVILVFLLPAAWSLLHPGFFVSDDGEWMVIRLTAFHQALASGEIPVRFAFRLNHEYGYPIFNFAYPGGFYLGEFFHLLGANFVDSIKLVFGSAIVLSAIFAFLWLKTRFSLAAALLGSLFYIYSPYFLWDIYKRGSMGEVLALAMVSLFFWSVEKKQWWFTGLAYGLLIISHNIIAFIFTPILMIDIFLTIRPLLRSVVYGLQSTVLGLGLSCFFWLPAIFELGLTVFTKTVVGNPLENLVTKVSLLGWLNIIVVFLGLLFWLKKPNRLVGFFIIVFLLSIFFSSKPGSFFWKIFPWPFLIQYPFRFLSLTLPAIAFLASFGFDNILKRKKTPFFLIGFSLLIFSAMSFISPAGYFQKAEGFYTTNEHSTAIHDEYTPVWVKIKPSERPNQKVELIYGQNKIENLKNNGRQIRFTTSSTIPSIVRVNTLYYPGWQVLIDGNPSKFSYQNEKGVMDISLQAGEHQVLVEFRETPLRAFSDIISLISLIGLIGLISIKTFRQ